VANIGELRSKATLDDAESQYLLGTKYETGEEIAIDYNEAMQWYRLAADKGLAKAQFKLGLAYQYGFSSNLTYPQSLFIIYDDYATDYDVDCAVFAYGQEHGIKDDFKQAIHWYQLAANQGDAEAQYELGTFYFYGVVVERSLPEAFRFTLMAGEQGLAKAQLEVGSFYESGFGCKKAPGEAIRWYQLAAEQNLLPAILKMATRYHRGKGVPKSKLDCLKLYRKAVELGHKDSQLCVQQLEEELNSIIPFTKRK